MPVNLLRKQKFSIGCEGGLIKFQFYKKSVWINHQKIVYHDQNITSICQNQPVDKVANLLKPILT